MIKLHKLNSRTLRRLVELRREEPPSVPTLEVERIIFGGTARSHVGDPGSAFFLLDDANRIIGAALHYNHEELPYVQYIAAVFLDHRFRGAGQGRDAFASVVTDARQRSGRPYVAWVVHPENSALLKLGRTHAHEFGIDHETGYLQFVVPGS